MSDESPKSHWAAAKELGIDMDLLRESMALSPQERLRLHDIAMRRVLMLEKAMKSSRAKRSTS